MTILNNEYGNKECYKCKQKRLICLKPKLREDYDSQQWLYCTSCQRYQLRLKNEHSNRHRN